MLSENLTIVTISGLAAQGKAQLFQTPCVYLLPRYLGINAFEYFYQCVCMEVPEFLLKVRWTQHKQIKMPVIQVIFSFL